MRVLALDTTTRDGSSALVVDGDIVDERRGDASRTHAERLPAELLALLEPHELELADIDLFAIASGPGSFTGLRIGIAAVQGLALVRSRPVVAVSALAALAQLASRGAAEGVRVGAWIDARRRQVFSALYAVGAGRFAEPARLIEVEGAAVGDPVETLARWQARDAAPAVLAGDGAVLYGDVIEKGAPAARIIGAPLLAGIIGLVAAESAQHGAAAGPAAIQPLYIRRPDAELARQSAPASAPVREK
jgi:tRNA threonylcarbamoyladenosine biosynthesis protein TsaB